MKRYRLIFSAFLAMFSEFCFSCAGKAHKTQVDFAIIETSLKMFKLDNGRFPTEEEGLKILIELPVNSGLKGTYRKDGYLLKMPTDQNGNMYIYELKELGGESWLYLRNTATGENNMQTAKLRNKKQ